MRLAIWEMRNLNGAIVHCESALNEMPRPWFRSEKTVAMTLEQPTMNRRDRASQRASQVL
jgi:hypothetical protein